MDEEFMWCKTLKPCIISKRVGGPIETYNTKSGVGNALPFETWHPCGSVGLCASPYFSSAHCPKSRNGLSIKSIINAQMSSFLFFKLIVGF